MSAGNACTSCRSPIWNGEQQSGHEHRTPLLDETQGASGTIKGDGTLSVTWTGLSSGTYEIYFSSGTHGGASCSYWKPVRGSSKRYGWVEIDPAASVSPSDAATPGLFVPVDNAGRGPGTVHQADSPGVGRFAGGVPRTEAVIRTRPFRSRARPDHSEHHLTVCHIRGHLIPH